MTMTENGSVVPYAYCDVWRFDGDRIAELRAFVIKTKPIATT
jgi:ketosteroid isomerase-like protein